MKTKGEWVGVSERHRHALAASLVLRRHPDIYISCLETSLRPWISCILDLTATLDMDILHLGYSRRLSHWRNEGHCHARMSPMSDCIISSSDALPPGTGTNSAPVRTSSPNLARRLDTLCLTSRTLSTTTSSFLMVLCLPSTSSSGTRSYSSAYARAVASLRRCSELVWLAFFCAAVRGTRDAEDGAPEDVRGFILGRAGLAAEVDLRRDRAGLAGGCGFCLFGGRALDEGQGAGGDSRVSGSMSSSYSASASGSSSSRGVCGFDNGVGGARWLLVFTPGFRCCRFKLRGEDRLSFSPFIVGLSPFEVTSFWYSSSFLFLERFGLEGCVLGWVLGCVFGRVFGAVLLASNQSCSCISGSGSTCSSGAM